MRWASSSSGIAWTALTRAETTKITRKRLVRASRELAAYELNTGALWRLKYFSLFPILEFVLGRLDHYCRVVFPLGFLVFCLTIGGEKEIDFGSEHYALLRSSMCYKDVM